MKAWTAWLPSLFGVAATVASAYWAAWWTALIAAALYAVTYVSSVRALSNIEVRADASRRSVIVWAILLCSGGILFAFLRGEDLRMVLAGFGIVAGLVGALVARPSPSTHLPRNLAKFRVALTLVPCIAIALSVYSGPGEDAPRLDLAFWCFSFGVLAVLVRRRLPLLAVCGLLAALVAGAGLTAESMLGIRLGKLPEVTALLVATLGAYFHRRELETWVGGPLAPPHDGRPERKSDHAR